MEAIEGACFLDEEWESLHKIFGIENPEVDFPHFLGHNSHFPSDNLAPNEGLFSLLVSDHNPNIVSLSDQFCTQDPILTPDSNHFPQSSSTSDLSGSSYVNTLNQLTQLLNNDDQISSLSSSPFDFLVDDGLLMDQVSVDQTFLIENDGQDDYKKRKCIEDDQAPLPKKRTRVSKHAEKGKRKMQPKKNKLDGLVVEEESNGQNSSFDNSDNDQSNASQDVIDEEPKEILNINGKKRASRGAATDPQSLYARKRRERINERLRILQKLVPNGTKVDISTMLEEAVQYVKFLQLQIKLLSSDELWMYAPLAYNGYDVGLYKRFPPYLQCP